MFNVRRGGGEEIPLIQGKEQWLRFAGAAVNPEKPTGSTYSSTSGLSPHEQLGRQAEFHSSTQHEP